MSTFSYRLCPACLLGLVLLLVATSGCGGGDKKLTINGTVTYKGQPISGGMLQFAATQGGAPAAAVINKDGTYSMTGVTPGEVKVSITATPGAKLPADLPEKYYDPEKSGLKYTITPNTTQLDIKMD
jgi:hypothetical protein